MKKHLFTILIGAASMVAGEPARAQSIVATHDAYGHTVWVEGDDAKPQPKPQTPQPAPITPITELTPIHAEPAPPPAPAAAPQTSSRYSDLVYWSNKQHRWVPVPLASSATMQAARRAAREVNDMIVVPTSRSGSRTLALSRPVNLGEGLTQVTPQ